MDLQRMVQVDGGEAVSLETCFKVNDCFSSSERADCIASLEAHGEWRYPIGGGGFCTITWATPRAALETEWRDWLRDRPAEYAEGDANENLMFNHDLSDEDRVWLQGYTARWLAMEEAERIEASQTAPHTNDVGLAIRDALDLLEGIECMDWDQPEPTERYKAHDIVTDAGHGFSDLRVEVGGALFRVSITRIG